MKKIWQKSLASMVSAAICLTAFVGCLTVNAATNTYGGTITSAGTEISTEAKVATVDLVVTSSAPEGVKGMAYTGLKATTAFGKLTNAEVTSDNAYVETKVINGETDHPTEIPDIGADGQFIVAASDTQAGVKSFTVSLTFEKTVETLTAGVSYDVNIEYLGTKSEIGAANWDEDAFVFNTEGIGKITVASSHTHTWKFDSGTPATGSNNSSNVEYTKGSITLKCADCGSEKTEVVNYSYYSRAQDSGLEYGSETMLLFGTRYENDHPRIAPNANITDGYIVLTQKRLDTTVATVATQMKKCDSSANVNGQKIYQTKIGIVSFAMSDDVTSTFYAYDSTSNAWYSGFQMTYSVKSAAENILASSNIPTQKAALVNLLNYGASAQVFFAQKPEHAELSNVVRSNAGIDAYQSFATTPRAYDGPAMNFVYKNDGSFVFCFYKSDLLLESKTTNRIYFRIPASYSGSGTAVDMTGYTVEITYTDFLGKSQTATYTSDQFQPEGRVNRFYIDVPFRTPDLRQVSTFVVKNPEGVAAGPASTVSVENIAKDITSTTADTTQRNMINSLMAFSDAAYDYLTTKN